MGGTVGLYTAALDSRVDGLVSISGFTPMRTDTADRGTGGVARYSQERGLDSAAGFLRRARSSDSLTTSMISLPPIAPRPVMIVEPQLDRDGTPADVHAAIDRARTAYAASRRARKLGSFRTLGLYSLAEFDPGRNHPLDASEFSLTTYLPSKPRPLSQFVSSVGQRLSAGSPRSSPTPCGPFSKMCISAGTLACRSAR